MDYSDSDRKVPATKKIPSRSVLTHLLGTSKNARLYTLRALAPDQAPLLMHLLGTSENARSYTSRALAPDQAPVLTHLLGTSENAQSHTPRALALVRPSTRPHAPSRDERDRTIVHLRVHSHQTKRPSSRTFSGRARAHDCTPQPRVHSHQTKDPSSCIFSKQARSHDRTPRAHLHQSPICLHGRRNRGHRNANQVGRRIRVAMSTWSLCRSPQER